MTILEFLNGSKSGGFVKGTIKSVNTRKAGDYTINDITLDDGTGEMVIGVFGQGNYPVGAELTCTQCYVREWNGTKTLSVRRTGQVTVNQGGTGSTGNATSNNSGNNTSNGGNGGQASTTVALDITPLVDEIIKLRLAITDFGTNLMGQLKVMSKVQEDDDSDDEE